MTENDVYQSILDSAMCKPCYVDFTGEILDQIGDDQMERVDQVAGAILADAIKSAPENISKTDWRAKAEASLLLCGSVSVDLDRFYDAVMNECKAEMGAYVIAKSMLNAGASPEMVSEQVEAELQSE